MSDLLDMDYINSLPQPLFLMERQDIEWPVHDFEVESGLFRIDVCGLLQVKHIGGAIRFRDCNGTVHWADDLYADPACWIDRGDHGEGESL